MRRYIGIALTSLVLGVLVYLSAGAIAGPSQERTPPAPDRADAEARAAGPARLPTPQLGELALAVSEIERLDRMRSSLARSVAVREAPPDRETFDAVCRPVGAEANRLAERNGWEVAQLSDRYRSPAHAPDRDAAEALARFRETPDLWGTWRRVSGGGREGVRYFRRIVVEEACLACHGARDARPEFIVRDYPDDRAFGFSAGDLRGLYSVFIPEDDGRRGAP